MNLTGKTSENGQSSVKWIRPSVAVWGNLYKWSLTTGSLVGVLSPYGYECLMFSLSNINLLVSVALCDLLD